MRREHVCELREREQHSLGAISVAVSTAGHVASTSSGRLVASDLWHWYFTGSVARRARLEHLDHRFGN